MDAFILAATSGEILIEKYYKNDANRSWIDSYLRQICQHQSILSNHGTLQPVKLVNEKGFIQIQRNDILLLGVLSREFPPLILIETFHRMADNIASHFDEPVVSEQLIKSHYSSILALVDEMIDFGAPSTLEPDALQMLVPQQSAFSHALQMISPSRLVANVMGNTIITGDSDLPGDGMGTGSGVGGGSGITGCGSQIWWRRGNISSPSNEVFVDLVERLNCLVDRKGKLLSSYIIGDTSINSHLKGIPSFKLILKNPQVLGEQPVLSFHPSVNTQKWKRDQAICFIPPNARFTLLQYSLRHPDLTTPLNITANFTFPESTYMSKSTAYCSQTSDHDKSTIENRTGKFEILLQPRQGFGTIGSLGSNADIVLENVRLSIPLPKWVKGITTGEISSGSVKFSDKQKTLTWSFSRFPLDTKVNFCPKCEGTLNLESKNSSVIINEVSQEVLKSSHNQPDGSPSTTTDDQSSSGDDDVNEFTYGYSHFPSKTMQRSQQTASSQNSVESKQLELDSLHPRDVSFAAFLTFWLPHRTLSGLQIDSLEISGADGNITKMVRSATTAAKIEYRL